MLDISLKWQKRRNILCWLLTLGLILKQKEIWIFTLLKKRLLEKKYKLTYFENILTVLIFSTLLKILTSLKILTWYICNIVYDIFELWGASLPKHLPPWPLPQIILRQSQFVYINSPIQNKKKVQKKSVKKVTKLHKKIPPSTLGKEIEGSGALQLS